VEDDPGARFRRRIALFALRHGGRPLPRRTLQPLRDFATSALGIGSAHLDVRESGEAKLVRALAARWRDRAEVTVFDVGAYAGDYAADARAAFGPKARIHCFEPNEQLFPSLARRYRDEPRTPCHFCALSRASGTGQLVLDGEYSPRASLERRSFDAHGIVPMVGRDVEVRTVDEVAAELGLTRIDLLKLDVEGHELAVLEGASTVLGQDAVDAIQFEFGEANLGTRTYLRDFYELLGPGFHIARVGPTGFQPLDYAPKQEIFVGETNYVALRDR
jgi:FkbM family methyltransferase